MLVKNAVTAVLLSLTLVAAGCGDADDGGSGSKKPTETIDDEGENSKKKPAAKKSPSEKKPAAKKPGSGKDDGGDNNADNGNTGGDDNSTDDDVVVDDRPACEIAWDDYRDYNEVGDFLKYKILTVSNFGAGDMESESLSTQEVIANEEESVTWKYTTETNGQAFESQAEILKVDFIEGCNNTEEEEPEDEGDENISVPAGSFDTHWEKYRRAIQGGESVTTSYMHELDSGDTIMVKSVADTELETGTMNSTTELLETNKD